MSATNMTIETLEDLARYIRKILPRSVTLEGFRLDHHASAVRFYWEKKQYVVKKSMRVFEVKGRRLYLTAPSLLLQSLLIQARKGAKITAAVLEVIREVESLIGPQQQPEIGLKLLGAVKKTIGKLAEQQTGRQSRDKAEKPESSIGESPTPAPRLNKTA
jgi:hypothetical protein